MRLSHRNSRQNTMHLRPIRPPTVTVDLTGAQRRTAAKLAAHASKLGYQADEVTAVELVRTHVLDRSCTKPPTAAVWRAVVALLREDHP